MVLMKTEDVKVGDWLVLDEARHSINENREGGYLKVKSVGFSGGIKTTAGYTVYAQHVSPAPLELRPILNKAEELEIDIHDTSCIPLTLTGSNMTERDAYLCFLLIARWRHANSKK